jgi:hypothetical protein
MDDMHSSISAMLDDEPFDAAALAASLETREGRDLLIDLVALRHLVQAPIAEHVPGTVPRQRPTWRLLAAAAIVLAAVSGYAVGQRHADGSPVAAVTAPTPTRVVETTATWQLLPPGGLQ